MMTVIVIDIYNTNCYCSHIISQEFSEGIYST